MQRHIDEILQPLEYIERYSLGANIVSTPSNRYTVEAGMIDLQTRISQLNQSKHPDDQAAALRIDKTFHQNDFHVATNELQHSLDNPFQNNILNWVETATPRDLEQFCQWSLRRTTQLQSSLYRDSRELISDTLTRAGHLQQIGFFSDTAAKIIGDSMHHTRLLGMDTFYASGRDFLGVSRPRKIILSNQYNDPVRMIHPSLQMKKTLFHENLHNVRPHYGFNLGITSRSHGTVYLEEAFVEHASIMAFSTDRNYATIYPNKRPHNKSENGSYPAERTFLAFILDHIAMTSEQVAETFFSRYDDTKGERLRTEMDRKIGRFFGSQERFAQFSNEYNQARTSERGDLLKRQMRIVRGSRLKNSVRRIVGEGMRPAVLSGDNQVA